MNKETTAWHQTRWASVVFAVVGLGLFYAVASVALNSGSLIQYTIAIVLALVSIRYIVRAVRGR